MAISCEGQAAYVSLQAEQGWFVWLIGLVVVGGGEGNIEGGSEETRRVAECELRVNPR